MVELLFWTGLLRIAQVVLQAIPTILVGLLVAGIFRRLLGYENTRKLFGCGTRRELPQTWLIGMALPVCSLGVIPVVREMRKAGVAGGTVLAFAMTAPLFNPLSLLYGLTLSEPFVIFAFAMAALVVVTVVGGLWDRLYPGTANPAPEPPAVGYGLKRMIAVAVVAAREITGPTLGYLFIGLCGVGLLNACLPMGSLSSTMEHTNPYAPLVMTIVAIPAYAGPMTAMSQLGSMFQHANSVGAAFVLLTLGAGLNLGLLVWMVRNYGFVRSCSWMGILLAVVLGLAYAMESPLHPDAVEPAGHTHAFDIYCRPYEIGKPDLAATVFQQIRKDIQPHERVGLLVVTGLILAGVVLRVLDRRWVIEHWLERVPAETKRPAHWSDMHIPNPVLGAFALLALVAFSIVGCFAYYPAKEEVFEEMRILSTEVLSAAMTRREEVRERIRTLGSESATSATSSASTASSASSASPSGTGYTPSRSSAHAMHFIPIWDDWTRRLQVGIFLREGRLAPYRRMKAKVFRDHLEFLKHAVEDHELSNVAECEETVQELSDGARNVQNAYRRMKDVYLR